MLPAIFRMRSWARADRPRGWIAVSRSFSPARLSTRYASMPHTAALKVLKSILRGACVSRCAAYRECILSLWAILITREEPCGWNSRILPPLGRLPAVILCRSHSRKELSCAELLEIGFSTVEILLSR